MFRRPGTSESRVLKLKDEIARILIVCLCEFIFAVLFLGFMVLEAMIIGPAMGTVVLAIVLFYVMKILVAPMVYEQEPDHWALYTLLIFLLVLFLSGAGTYPLFDAIWPPPLPWEFDTWVILLGLAICGVGQLALGMGMYLFASEGFDPNGPTATRKPVDHPTTIWPFTKVGVQPVVAPAVNLAPRLVRIHHEGTNPRGRAANRDLLLPDSAAWHQYARALSNRVASFSESAAKNFGITPQDKADEIGFRSVRDTLLERGYVHWKNPTATNMGYEFEDGFYELMSGWSDKESET